MAESEFGGWSKIDCSDAAELAEIVSTFSRSTVKERTRMLLTLFANQSRDGTIAIGYRTLAERANVTIDKAKHFLASLERDGWLVTVGTKKNRLGTFAVRRFNWVEVGEVGPKNAPPWGQNSRKNAPPWGEKSRKNAPQQSTHSTHMGVAADGLTPVAAPQDPNEDELFAAIERRKRRAEQLRIERMGGEASANS